MSQIIMQIAGWLISPILAFVIGRLTIKLNSLQAYNAKKDEMAKSESVAIKETCKYVLKKSLKDDYDFYVEQQGWCSVVDKAEVESLMDKLLELPNPFTCPHGRPTAIKMSKYDIERKFARK